MAPVNRFRQAGKQVLLEQRFVRSAHETVLKVDLPSLDENECQSSTFQVGPTGKLVFDPPPSEIAGEQLDFDGGIENDRNGRSSLNGRNEGQGEVGGATTDSGKEEAPLRPEDDESTVPFAERHPKQRRGVAKSTFKFASSCFRRIRGPWDNLFLEDGRRTGKSQDVFEYDSTFPHKRVTPTTRIRTLIRSGSIGFCLRLLDLVATALAVILYIHYTYTFRSTRWLHLMEVIVNATFLVDFSLKLFSAPIRIAYLLSLGGLVDLVSVLPIFFLLFGDNWDRLRAIPQIFMFFRSLRVLPLIREQALFSDTVSQQLFSLCSWVFSILFVGAGLFQFVETYTTPKAIAAENNCGERGCYTYFDSFYFMVVTVSTVGFGDVSANSNLGRIVVILALILALTYIPAQINRILDVADRRPYGGKISLRQTFESPHVILWGMPSLGTVREFLSQFYHPVHMEDKAISPLRVVIMTPYKPSFELKSMIGLYGGLVEYIEGHPMKSGDLDRVAAQKAAAIFLAADRQSTDFDASDSIQFLHATSFHRHCGRGVRVIVEMLRGFNQGGAVWDDTQGVEVLCPDITRFKLLARSCVIKGLTTFCTNLFRSGPVVSQRGLEENWMKEYMKGQENEIYPVLLPPVFHQLLYEEVTEFVFRCFGIVIFALDVVKDEKRKVLLSPFGRVVRPTDVALTIAPDLKTAQFVSRFHQKKKIPHWAVEEGKAKKVSLTDSYKWHKDALNLLDLVRTAWREKSTSVFPSLEHLSQPYGKDPEVEKFSKGKEGENLVESTTLSDGASVSKTAFEDIVETFLRWPPVDHFIGPPHPAILDEGKDAILRNLQERTLSAAIQQKSHILVAIPHEWPGNLYYFVSTLRETTLDKPIIVFLRTMEPSYQQWGCVGHFPEVFYVKGSPAYELDLMRAGLFAADKVVIFSPDASNDPSCIVENGDFIQSTVHTPRSFAKDVRNIEIVATVERLLKNSNYGQRVLCEVQHKATFGYFRPQHVVKESRLNHTSYERNREDLLSLVPSFMEGKVFSPSLLQFLMYKTFYIRNSRAILDQLLECGPVFEPGRTENTRKVQLRQIPLPEQFHGKVYGDMVVELLRKQSTVALGLYRRENTNGAPTAYVYTNAKGTTELHKGDIVYILVGVSAVKG